MVKNWALLQGRLGGSLSARYKAAAIGRLATSGIVLARGTKSHNIACICNRWSVVGRRFYKRRKLVDGDLR